MERNGSWLNGVVAWSKLPRLHWQGILLLFLKKWIEGLNYDTSYLSWFILEEIFASFQMVLSVAYFFLSNTLISRYLEDPTEEFQQESIACVILVSLSSFYERSIDWTVEEVSYVGKLVGPCNVCCSHKYVLHYFLPFISNRKWPHQITWIGWRTWARVTFYLHTSLSPSLSLSVYSFVALSIGTGLLQGWFNALAT